MLSRICCITTRRTGVELSLENDIGPESRQRPKDKPDKFIFILNPTAGQRKALELKEQLQKRFEDEGLQSNCIFAFTERPLHATELARSFAEEYGERAIIFACGGDGTVNEVANGLAGSASLLSVIPAGTGNDFIKSLFSTSGSSEIIGRLFEYSVKKIDMANIDGRYFVNVASLGFDTIVGDKAKRMVAKVRFLGGTSYFLAIFVCLFGKNYSKVRYTLRCVNSEGKETEISERKEFVLSALANGGYYGGMFHPCPYAKLDDGLIDVCIVDRISIPQILSMIPKYIKGTHTEHKAVHIYKVISGHMEGDGEELLVNCDGESFNKKSIDFGILPSAISVAYY
ncbi:diacylglycerol kinase family lipid kinase [Candidatus Nomurabacteria bacterium]|nr:diacylglycerol kinase family lipid kinase [Candidatus Nomurabacteria bacterium]